VARPVGQAAPPWSATARSREPLRAGRGQRGSWGFRLAAPDAVTGRRKSGTVASPCGSRCRASASRRRRERRSPVRNRRRGSARRLGRGRSRSKARDGPARRFRRRATPRGCPPGPRPPIVVSAPREGVEAVPDPEAPPPREGTPAEDPVETSRRGAAISSAGTGRYPGSRPGVTKARRSSAVSFVPRAPSRRRTVVRSRPRFRREARPRASAGPSEPRPERRSSPARPGRGRS
jgi:hypothetical protein